MYEDLHHGVTLVLGGAASGKSRYAQKLAEEHTGSLLYVATAQPGDAEMQARIARHRKERSERWQTLEEPLDLVGRLPRAMDGMQAVLIDCVTLWLTNLLLAGGEDPAKVWPAVKALLELVRNTQVPVIFVSNELGMGLVPEHPIGRIFRDLAGAVNQCLAASADRVYLVAAGLPLQMK